MHDKLPHVKWILPNAPEDRDAMGQAWYTPRAFPSPLKPRIPAHEDEDDDGEEEDEEEILRSVEYLDSIVKAEIAELGAAGRVVVGGFSQGCAVGVLWGLMHGWKRRGVGGIVGLSGYLPLERKVEEEAQRQEKELGDEEAGRKGPRWFLAHGSRDMLVPGKMFRQMVEAVKKAMAGDDGVVEEHLYEGMGHATSGAEIRDLCKYLEGVVPEKA